MLGSIIGIEENTVLIKPNIDLTKFDSLVNLHVIMEHSDKKIVGEIADIKQNILYVNLLGEIINNKFVFGVIRKPAFSSSVKLISKEKIPMLIADSITVVSDKKGKNYYTVFDLSIGGLLKGALGLVNHKYRVSYWCWNTAFLEYISDYGRGDKKWKK